MAGLVGVEPRGWPSHDGFGADYCGEGRQLRNGVDAGVEPRHDGDWVLSGSLVDDHRQVPPREVTGWGSCCQAEERLAFAGLPWGGFIREVRG